MPKYTIPLFICVLSVFTNSVWSQEAFPSGGKTETKKIISSDERAVQNMNQGIYSTGKTTPAAIPGFKDDPRIRVTIETPKPKPRTGSYFSPSLSQTPVVPSNKDVPQASKNIPVLTPNIPIALDNQKTAVNANECFNGVRLQWLSPATISWDMSSGLKNITALHYQHNVSSSRINYDSLGATVATTSFEHANVVAKNGCSEMHIKAGYSKMEVKIANELVANECALNHIKTHELKHVAIYQNWYEKMQRELPEKISYFLLQHKKPSNQEIMHFIEREWFKVRQLHDELDSPEEYLENQYACNRVIPRLLRNIDRYN